jgi:hypothetical protein
LSSTTRASAADNTPAEAPKGDERAEERPAEQQPTPESEPESVEAGENTEAAAVLEPGTDATTADDDTADTLAPPDTSDASPIPGSGGFDLVTPVVVAGVEWIPADGDPLGAPIGTALAAEMAASA